MKNVVKTAMAATAAVALAATPSVAEAWSNAEVGAAVATIDTSTIRECAAGAGGQFTQTTAQRDINGDGVNELIVYTTVSGASGCVGQAGQEIDLLIPDGNGGWSRHFGFDAHGLNFYDRPGSEWPDVEISGPGFCFPIWRHHDGGYGLWKTCEDGRLVFAEGLREGVVPARTDAASAGAGAAQATAVAYARVAGTPSRTGVPSQPVEIADTERLDGGMPYLHNGSVMWVYPEHGLIVYEKPRSGLSIKPGTVLFKGRPWSSDNSDNTIIKGRAFTFRKGCEAAGYEVRGIYHHLYGIAEFTLEGLAPVRRKAACDIVGHDMNSENAKLRFEAAWD